MRIAIKWVLCVTTVLSTAASLAGGLLMYWESLASLKETVMDISEAQTEIVANELAEFYEQPPKVAASLKTFLWNMNFSSYSDDNPHLDILKWMALARINSTDGVLQEIGLVCLDKSLIQQDPGGWSYYHVWYDQRDNTPDDATDANEKIFVVASRDQGEPLPVNVRKLDRHTGEVQEAPILYSFDFGLANTAMNSWDDILTPKGWNGTAGDYFRWRDPQTWTTRSTSSNVFYNFQAYDHLYAPPTDVNNPLSKCGSVVVQTYFIYPDWKRVIDEHKNTYPLDTVVVVDADTNWVFASSSLGDKEEVVNQSCAFNSNGETVAVNDTCALRYTELQDTAARDATEFLLEERRQQKLSGGGLQYTSFHDKTVGGTKNFIRRSEVIRTPEGIPGVNVVVIWLRPASVVQDKVNKALTYLLIFVSLVFFVDIMLALVEVMLIARPLIIIAKALEQAGTMEGLEEANEIKSKMGTPVVMEVSKISESFDRMIDWLFAYRPFIPECVRKATGKEFSDNMPMNPLERPMSEDDNDLEGRPQTPRTDIQSTCTIETCDDKATTQSSSTSVANNAKFLMLQGRERRLRSRTATLVLAELDSTQNISGQKLSAFVETVLDVGRQFESVTLQVVGSGVLLAWNTHVPCPLHTQHGADCALAIASALANNTKGQVGWWGLAIVTGVVQVGIAGAAKHRASVIVGEPVGLAAALANLGRRLKVRIVASGDTYDKVRSTIKGRPVDVISLPPDPEREPVGQDTVYELMNRDFGDSFKTGYVEGFSAIKEMKYTEACEKFSTCVINVPTDKQSMRLLRLAMGNTAGNEYCRKSLGWQNLEDACNEVELPVEVRRAVENSQPALDEDSLEGQEVVTSARESVPLRKQIEMQTSAPGHFHAKHLIRFQSNNREWLKSKKHIGSGGYGEVALGMEGGEGTLAAFKMVRLPKTTQVMVEEDTRLLRHIDELQREVDILNDLKHDSVVSYLGSSVVNGFVIIIMEYVSGGSLDRVIKDFGEIPLAVVKRYTVSILAGLEFLHKNKIVHRDLKPHNVLMTPEGQCKLADFGAAAVLTTITKDQMKVVGTPLYMSPEACNGDIRYESDIWAVGIIVIELAFGELHVTWKSELAGGYNQQAFTDKLLYKETMVPHVPSTVNWEVSNFAKRCFKRKASDRPSAHSLRSSPFLLS